MKKLFIRLQYLWMRLKSKTPSLFNYANVFWIIMTAVVSWLKIEQKEPNFPPGLSKVVDHAYLITGVIGIILLKLPTSDKVLQSDISISEKVAIKKEEG